MVVLLCLTPVFRNMPQNAQAAVIIAAVVGLFRYDEFVFLWKVTPFSVTSKSSLANHAPALPS
jgi:MFS superfamily sulfate permease-like transporter